MSVRILGVRHHGPGSARSVATVLQEWQPDAVLIEGPPEADALIPLAAHASMRPPVALLLYRPDQPQQACYFPFAQFSPEWQALQYGVHHAVPTRFIDLPQTHWFALQEGSDPLQRDPLAQLAAAAGYSDAERWWEHTVEQRLPAEDLFTAILEAMTALRASPEELGRLDQLREASMRQNIRASIKEGRERIAVVCGAWHGPALAHLPSAKQDAELLKGLPKTKVQAAWIPWTHGRLQWTTGYGAGVESPGWYEHLWRFPHNTAAHWMARVARLLREKDLDASPAQVMEALRLSETLAALRDRPVPGLSELMESIQTVLLFADRTPLRLIHDQLIVGEALGSVPEEAPILPLQQDLAALQKRLRLKPEAGQKTLDLDLRDPTGRERSTLLHRLQILQVPWGRPQRMYGKSGTFHEAWTLQWQPELTLAVISAGMWGNTVEEAANVRAGHAALQSQSLPELIALLETALQAALQEAVPILVQQLQTESAVTADLAHLIGAVPALARLGRYSDVRATDQTLVSGILGGILTRIAIGLPAACRSLDDGAAVAMRQHIEQTQSAVRLLENAEWMEEWQEALRRVAQLPHVHGLVAGLCIRLLLDSGASSPQEAARAMQFALSPGVPPSQGAYWLQGFLSGSALLLLHQDALWTLIDEWVSNMSVDRFTTVLPLLARTFSTFSAAERRQLGKFVRLGGKAAQPAGQERYFDRETALASLSLLAKLFGPQPIQAEEKA